MKKQVIVSHKTVLIEFQLHDTFTNLRKKRQEKLFHLNIWRKNVNLQ